MIKSLVISNPFQIEVNHVKKSVVFVVLWTSKSLVKPNYINSASGVDNAKKLLFGKSHMSKNITNNNGLNYGSKKVTAYDN